MFHTATLLGGFYIGCLPYLGGVNVRTGSRQIEEFTAYGPALAMRLEHCL